MPSALAWPGDDRSERPERPIRLMIVDDSMVARAVFSRMIEADSEFEIVAVAGTAEDAIQNLDNVHVDVVMLDLEMPGAGGLKMLPQILAAARGAQVLVVSSLADEGAEATVTALALGAADTLPKPGTGRFNGRFSEILLAKLRVLGRAGEQPADQPTSTPQPATPIPSSLLRPFPGGPVKLLALGASTGGIHALAGFFQALPGQIGAPILVTQHLPAPFMSVFARQLGVAAHRETLVAEDGLRLLPDRIIVAPGDASIELEVNGGRMVIRLDPERSTSGCLPSVDPMLASAGRLLGDEAVGVVLSGIGRDGLEGSMAMVAAGGSVLVQDQNSSAVWGMPRAIAEAGMSSGVLPPAEIAEWIGKRVKEAACR